MGKYQAYEKYKNSGVEWLGEIPEHWKRSVFRYYFDIQLGKMLQNTPQSENDEEVSYLKAIHVKWDKVDTYDLPQMWASPRDKEKYNVKNGDLLISEGGEVGRTALLSELQEDCIIQNALHRVRPLSQSSVEYLSYLMRHISDTGWFDILCNKSTIAHLTSEKLGALALSLPPLDEQYAIAQFLDYKTKQIDELIAKKEALLEKLNEKRTALISHAVTKGLDPNVPMKDSGIEWLGEIPESWRLTRLRFLLCKLEQGWSPLCHNYPAEEGEWGVLKVGCVNGTKFDSSDNKLLPNDLEPKIQYEIMDGDILMSRANTKEILGSAALVINPQEKLILCDKLYRLKTKNNHINSKYLVLLLSSSIARFQYERDATGTSGSMQNIGQDTVKDLIIPLPFLIQQQAIAQFLDHKTQQIDEQKAKIKEAIELLKEYRTALITNAVTGKIDVRQVPIPQPQKNDETN